MAIKDILLHLDASDAAPARLELAARLARRFDAHLIGLFPLDVTLPALLGGDMSGGAAMGELIQVMQDEALADAARLEALFRERLRRDTIPGEWRQTEGIASSQLALHGRHADLVVIGQPDPDILSSPGDLLAEAALFNTGRPVLMVPHSGAFDQVGRRALIGWNASREASRAVHDALPLLAGAESVTLLVIDPEAGGEGHGEEPGADIARHLARHGLPVAVRRVAGSAIAAGDVLLNEASDLGADLIVMGGYGHSRLREFVLGGTTRTLLRQMTVPVLLSH